MNNVSCIGSTLPTKLVLIALFGFLFHALTCIIVGKIVKDKHPKIHKTKQKVNSQLHGSHHAQIYENTEPRISAVPLNSLPMEDSPEMLGTGA